MENRTPCNSDDNDQNSIVLSLAPRRGYCDIICAKRFSRSYHRENGDETFVHKDKDEIK